MFLFYSPGGKNNVHMIPFFFSRGKWVPKKAAFYSFLAAGQDPGGEGKMAPRFGVHWGPDGPESSPKGLRKAYRKQETQWFNCLWNVL